MEPNRTREQARALFHEAGLSYAVLSPTTLQMLRTFIHRRMKASGCIQGSYRCRQRGLIKQSTQGTYAEIRCRAFYFEDREAVTFNADGFIGFAGWADDENVQPILQGFEDWVRHLTAPPEKN